jgi:hypothetical protein
MRNGRLPIIVPRDNKQVMATVRDVGEEQVIVGESTLTLYHLEVQPDGGELRHVWLDDLGRVIKVEIPSTGYMAVRTEIPA